MMKHHSLDGRVNQLQRESTLLFDKVPQTLTVIIGGGDASYR